MRHFRSYFRSRFNCRVSTHQRASLLVRAGHRNVLLLDVEVAAGHLGQRRRVVARRLLDGAADAFVRLAGGGERVNDQKHNEMNRSAAEGWGDSGIEGS